MDRIFIALGSSIGNATELFGSTELFLKKRGITILAQSQNHTFPPFGGVAKNDFTNAVWEVSLDQKLFAQRPLKRAHQLLSILQKCEQDHGRTRLHKWEDRTLDLDLLIFEGQYINSKRLRVPHPHMHTRDFVMIPLLEMLNNDS